MNPKQAALPVEAEISTDQPKAMAPRHESDGLALVVERLAANPQVDVDKLERIIALQERILAHQAKAAFDAAFSAMQGELPTILERGRTDKGKYATLEDIVETVRPILCRHHFSISHETSWPGGGLVKITGILSGFGHQRTSEFLTAADTSGSKNAVQALGSALSYGRRYTTLDLLNIVTTGMDDDARQTSPKAEVIPDEPVGFANWSDDMTAAAQEGGKVFNPAWDKSNPEFRAYALKYRRALTEGWKKTVYRAAHHD